jgi:hypothetical protein
MLAGPSLLHPHQQRGPQRNLAYVSPIIASSPIRFHLNRVGNGSDNDEISPEDQKIQKPVEVLI